MFNFSQTPRSCQDKDYNSFIAKWGSLNEFSCTMGALALCVAFGESLCGIRSWLVAGTHHTVPHFMSSRCKSTKQIINSNINSLERSFANATHLKHDDELSRRCPWCFSMTYNEMYLPQPPKRKGRVKFSSIPHCVFPIDFPMFSQYFSQMFSQYWKNIAPRFSTLRPPPSKGPPGPRTFPEVHSRRCCSAPCRRKFPSRHRGLFQ